MKIVIDGDGCPVKDITIDTAKEYKLEVIIFFDTAHVYQDDYAKVIYVNKGFDSVDFEILSKIDNGDIVVTGDYGLSGMLLTRGCKVISPKGLIITNSNIEQLLSQRFISQKARKAKVRTKGPKKRTNEDDVKYQKNLIRILNMSSS